MSDKHQPLAPDAIEFWLSDAPPAPTPTLTHDPAEEVTLLELLDKLLTKGVIVSGDLVLSVAGVDLLYVGLRLMVTTAEKAASVGAVRLEGGKIL